VLRRATVAVVVGVAILVAVAGGAATRASATTGVDPLQKITVRITDSKLIVNPKRVQRAVTVWFRVVNTGVKTHDFQVAGFKTKPLKHGQVDHVVLSFDERGAYLYRCVLNCTRVMRGQLAVYSPLGE
jgi:plastocyanin